MLERANETGRWQDLTPEGRLPHILHGFNLGRHLTVTGWPGVGGVGGRPSPALGGPLSPQGVKWAASSQKVKRGR